MYIYVCVCVSVHLYTYIDVYGYCPRPVTNATSRFFQTTRPSDEAACAKSAHPWSLQDFFFHFQAFMHKSIIHALPSPTCIAHNSAMMVHVCCAIHDPPRPPPPCVYYTLYNIGNAISCKSQVPTLGTHTRPKLIATPRSVFADEGCHRRVPA